VATVVDVLRRARQLIERGWVQGPFAITKDGTHCSPTLKCASAFCAAGARDRACHELAGSDLFVAVSARNLLNKSAESLGSPSYIHFNDKPGRTKGEVLEMFDKAIAIAQPDVQPSSTQRLAFVTPIVSESLAK